MSSPMDLLFDPNVLVIQDHFVSNDGVADTTVGELGWEITTIGTNASTLAYQTGGFGVLRATAGAGGADGEAFRLKVDTAATIPGTHIKARARVVTTTAGQNFRIGLMDTQAVTEPAVGIFFEGLYHTTDAVVNITGQADSAAGDNSSSILLTATAGRWMTFEALASGSLNSSSGPSEVLFRVIDEASTPVVYEERVNSLLTAAETCELSFIHWGASGVIFEIDYIGYQQVR